MRQVIVFRGRNTAAIIEDATRHGVILPGDKVVIICRQHDALAEIGDVTLADWRHDGPGDTVIIANGGTTAQLVPLLVRVVESAVRASDESDDYLVGVRERCAPRDWRWECWDVQRDGVHRLAGDPMMDAVNNTR